MIIKDWTESRLARSLANYSGPDAEAVRSLMHSRMPDIQAVLSAGGTSSLDFTLHDSGHAFRVAERMVDIVPEESLDGLSYYECALLLLSAYLHDIGMTPAKSHIAPLHSYLMSGNPGVLEPDNVNALQAWLDDYRSGITPPLTVGRDMPDALLLADEIVTYYAREKHNDWSEDWIRAYFVDAKMGAYSGWIEDLIALCRSHHYGYELLAGDSFRARIVGSPSVVVNLRYLAAVLRISDVLEFDPERTPTVVFRHRDVSSGSALYWYKDHEISLRQDSDRIVISARPRCARLHRAVEETVNQINDELTLCSRLSEEYPFNHCAGVSEPTPHRWILASTCHSTIEPLRGAYEYIDGAFRPDTARLLELLSGIDLYGSTYAAIRELIQNATDAVREQVAHVRLRRQNPEDPRHEQNLGLEHSINILVTKNEEGYWLVCSDTGVGMSKAIIRDHLLVSGRGRRHDVIDLERRCRASGFNLGRTGQFGIGVLSYFMLAKRVEISSRRSQQAGAAESHGWHFTTDGVGSFGELKTDPRVEHGTTVRMLLRPEVLLPNVEGWCKGLLHYLRDLLFYTPCRIDLSGEGCGIVPTSFGPGWSRSPEQLTSRSMAMFSKINSALDSGRQIPLDVLPAEEREKRVAAEIANTEVMTEFRNSIRWQAFTGDWKGFGLDRGRSPVLRARSRRQEHDNVLLEVDLTSDRAGRVSVDRNTAEFSEDATLAIRAAVASSLQALSELINSWGNSAYSLINARSASIDAALDYRGSWPVSGSRSQMILKPLQYPVIDSSAFKYDEIPEKQLSWRGKKVSVIPSLTDRSESSHWQGIGWHSGTTRPSKIVLFPKWRMQLAALWERPEDKVDARGVSAGFPPAWKLVVGAHFEDYEQQGRSQTIWNQNGKVFKSLTPEAIAWASATFSTLADPLPYKESILGNRALAAAWVAHCLKTSQSAIWNGLRDRDLELLPAVFRLLRIECPKGTKPRILFWMEETQAQLCVLTEMQWYDERVAGAREPLLPDPGLDWKLGLPDKERLSNHRHGR
jgi:hypothetical protein